MYKTDWSELEVSDEHYAKHLNDAKSCGRFSETVICANSLGVFKEDYSDEKPNYGWNI